MNCIPFPRVLPAGLQPLGFPTSLPRLGETQALRVCLFFDKPPMRARCGGRWLCTSNASYPLETCAMRQIGAAVVRKLRVHPALVARGVDVCEFNLEVELARGDRLPSYDVCVVLTHDWPTIHEDPAWAADWLQVVTSSRHTVPSRQQIVWLFEKTRYMADIASAFGENANSPGSASEEMILPTYFINASTDLNDAAEWAQRITPGKFVAKENFSAGKEGVTFVNFPNARVAKRKLDKLRKEAGVFVEANRKWRARQGSGKKKRIEAESYAAGFDFVHTIFRGGNKHVLMVQKYEKRFLTESEKRIFFSRGEFLYAMGHRGWVDTNSRPVELAGDEIKCELGQIKRLVDKLENLREYPLVRFDFGPDALLSEIEVLPDMFGGPAGNLTGKRWERIVEKVAEGYVHSIVSRIHT